MNANLLAMAQDALGVNFCKIGGQSLGESAASTQAALSALLPAAIGALACLGFTGTKPVVVNRPVAAARGDTMDGYAARTQEIPDALRCTSTTAEQLRP